MNASIGGELSEPTCRVYSMKQGGSKVIHKHRISAEPVRPKIRYIYTNIYIIYRKIVPFVRLGRLASLANYVHVHICTMYVLKTGASIEECSCGLLSNKHHLTRLYPNCQG